MQGVFLYIPSGIWPWLPVAAAGCGLAAFFQALNLRQPDLAVLAQGAAALMIFISLGQSALQGLPVQELAWASPALGFIPAFYLAWKRQSRIFALLAYGGALGLPLYLGLLPSRPELYSAYYLALYLPWPLFTRKQRRPWLSLLLPGGFLALEAFCLYQGLYNPPYRELRFFFPLFFAIYLLNLALNIRRPDFDPRRLPDFLFSFGLPLALGILQLQISAARENRFILSLAFFFLASVAGCRLFPRLLGEKGQSLGRLYWLSAFTCLNVGLHFLLDDTLALAAYCAETAAILWFNLHGEGRRKRAASTLFLLFLPLYFFLGDCRLLPSSAVLGLAGLACSLAHRQAARRLRRRAWKHHWASGQELFFLLFGLAWWFGGMGTFVFRSLPEPGLVFFALSSACAYSFYVLGKVLGFRSLGLVIFWPLLISVPAVLLPCLYQTQMEWPVLNHMLSYNYFGGLGALAWGTFFITMGIAMRRNWEGLVSNHWHNWFLGLLSLELILILTSSIRALALENGVSPSVLSSLAALPALGYILAVSYLAKNRNLSKICRRIILSWIPALLFVTLAGWFVLSLGSLGRDAPWGRYLPILNPVELTQISCILVFAYWQRRVRKSKTNAAYLSDGQMGWVYGLFAFLWLHGLSFRLLQYFSQSEPWQVTGFMELRFIFACLWILFGILLCRGGSVYASTLSWLLGLALCLGGSSLLIWIGAKFWGMGTAALLGLLSLALTLLICWSTPAPFTAKGRKLRER